MTLAQAFGTGNATATTDNNPSMLVAVNATTWPSYGSYGGVYSFAYTFGGYNWWRKQGTTRYIYSFTTFNAGNRSYINDSEDGDMWEGENPTTSLPSSYTWPAGVTVTEVPASVTKVTLNRAFFANISAGEADPTTGDVRKVIYGIVDGFSNGITALKTLDETLANVELNVQYVDILDTEDVEYSSQVTLGLNASIDDVKDEA
jgi:hypothetical protein